MRGSQSVPPEHLEPQDHETRRPDDDSERRPRELLPRRDPREPRHDHFKFALDRREVGAGLVRPDPS
jgi:hypothetical protein